MKLSEREVHHFCRLFAAVHDNRATAAEWGELDARVRQDGDIRQLYLRYMRVCGRLAWDCRELAAGESTVAPTFTDNRQPKQPLRPIGFAPRRTLLSLAASPLVSTLFVAMILYGGFGLLVWQMSRTQHQSIDRDNSFSLSNDGITKAAAKLVQSKGCQWEQGKLLGLGQSLANGAHHLIAGTAEIEFADGARIAIQGPCRFAIKSPSSVYLKRGNLVASVPQRAIGFTVDTPSAHIVDLGTKFGVGVDGQDATEVQVLEGKVALEVSATAPSAATATHEIVSAGMARKVEASGKDGTLSVRKAEWNPGKFDPKPQLLKRLRVEGALASSSAQWDVNNLINGNGLKGNAHSCHSEMTNASTGTMWHTALGRVKDEYVLFDLGRTRRIHSLKVWNYNETSDGLFAYRGVKRADIYVSSTGEGNPLSHPDAWRRVVTDKIFSPATGNDSYETPDVIELGAVEARFVALVIRECLGSDPRPQYTGKSDAVGLSEVQVFGEALSQPPSK